MLEAASYLAAAAASYLPLREPTLQEYYERLKDFEPQFYEHGADFEPKHAEVARVRNVTEKTFFALVRAGQPFVVEDCAPDHPYSQWPCSRFGEKWPAGHMKSEYSSEDEHILLGDAGPTAWHTQKRNGDRQLQHISNGSMLSGPYVWHVKDEVPEWMKAEVQENWQTPYFLQDRAVNRFEAWDSFEFWFSMPGGGVFAHADAYCEVAISTQLRGTKKWRLGMFPEVPTVFDSFDSTDRGIYAARGKWQPEYEFNVGPGECFVFPPGYIHETHLDPQENEECTVAATYQFNIPLPARYIRSFLPRFFNSHLVWGEKCNHRWESYFTFEDPDDEDDLVENNPVVTVDRLACAHGIVVFRDQSVDATMHESELRERVAQVFERLDSDGDQVLRREEIKQYYRSSKRGSFVRRKARWFAWSGKITPDELALVMEELIMTHVDDTIAYNDVDSDGAISFQELFESTLQYNVLAYKKKEIAALYASRPHAVNTAKQLELAFNLKYRCGDIGSRQGKDSRHCKYNSTYFERFPDIHRLDELPLFEGLHDSSHDTDLGEKLIQATQRLHEDQIDEL